MNKYLRLVTACLLTVTIFFSCSKESSLENNAIPTGNPASGTLKDSSGSCLPIVVHGTYYDGVITRDTNYVQITVNATTTGSYNIQTGIQNGFQFAGTGVFNSTGIQTISLKASGTPSQITSTNFTVTFNSSACNFTVNVLDSSAGGTSGIGLDQWQFVANGHTYSGKVSTAIFTNLIGASLTLVGPMASGSADTAFGISVEFPGTTLDTGSYVTSGAGTNFSLTLVQSGNIIYAANATAVPPVLSISISSYVTSTKTVTGIFSGQAYDFQGNTLDITDGKFKAQLQ